MSSNESDAAKNVMSSRQITELLITLLEHAEHNALTGLEANLHGSLEALMEDLKNKEREPPLSQTHCGANVVDFNEARRLLRDGTDGARMEKTGPGATTWT